MRPWPALLVLAVLGTALPAAAVPAEPSVLVLGDSYASGEGLPTAEGTCGTERERSWGALVAEELGAGSLQLLACSGARVADVTVGGPSERAPQLEEAARADLVLLTVGGNDFGFTELMADCLGLAALDEPPGGQAPQDGGWSDLVAVGTTDRGCDVQPEELLDRVASFAEQDRFPVGEDGASGSLATVHVEVAQRVVAEGGRLLLVGYPALFTEVARWPDRYGQRCHGLRAADVRALAGVVVALDEQLAAATQAANRALGADVVEHVSLLAAFDGRRDGVDHRLCGGGEPWVNGLTVVEGGVDVARLLGQLGAGAGGLDLAAIGARPGGSFHPSTAGHRGIADTVLDHLGG